MFACFAFFLHCLSSRNDPYVVTELLPDKNEIWKKYETDPVMAGGANVRWTEHDDNCAKFFLKDAKDIRNLYLKFSVYDYETGLSHRRLGFATSFLTFLYFLFFFANLRVLYFQKKISKKKLCEKSKLHG